MIFKNIYTNPLFAAFIANAIYSSIFAFAFYMFGLTFWGSNIFLFMCLLFWDKFVVLSKLENARKLELEAKEKQVIAWEKEIEALTLKTIPVSCCSCGTVNLVHINLDDENAFKCKNCDLGQVIKTEFTILVPNKSHPHNFKNIIKPLE